MVSWTGDGQVAGKVRAAATDVHMDQDTHLCQRPSRDVVHDRPHMVYAPPIETSRLDTLAGIHADYVLHFILDERRRPFPTR